LRDDLRCVLLLEADVWRLTGFERFLADRGIRVVDRLDGFGEPDVILAARALLGSDPQAMIERIRRRHPGVPILVHGEAERLETIAAMLAAGASGYFPLNAPQTQLLQALRVVRDGDLWAPRMAVALMARPASIALRHDTDDESVILDLLLEGSSNKDIASRLGLAEVTVKSRLTRLYKRYSVRTRLELVAAVIRQRADQ
jgi:DNA-binding NarL/FixJ family response regulator